MCVPTHTHTHTHANGLIVVFLIKSSVRFGAHQRLIVSADTHRRARHRDVINVLYSALYERASSFFGPFSLTISLSFFFFFLAVPPPPLTYKLWLIYLSLTIPALCVHICTRELILCAHARHRREVYTCCRCVAICTDDFVQTNIHSSSSIDKRKRVYVCAIVSDKNNARPGKFIRIVMSVFRFGCWKQWVYAVQNQSNDPENLFITKTQISWSNSVSVGYLG